MRERLPLRIAVFGSGRGTNFQEILAAMQRGRIPNAEIRIVISNNYNAGILDIARANRVPALQISEKKFSSHEEFVSSVIAALHDHDVNFIVLAGYMKRVPNRVISEFRNCIINIHPALLPKFGGQGMYGMRVHEAVIAAHEQFSGATVHIVDEEYDHGAIVVQKKIPVALDDTAETLAAKVLKVEHEIFPEAIRMFAEGRVGLKLKTSEP